MRLRVLLILAFVVSIFSGAIYEASDKTTITSGKYGSNVIAHLDGKYVREGKYGSGDVLFNIDGKYIKSGKWSSGSVVANIDGNYIRKGKWSSNDIIANIDGDYIKEGRWKSNDVIAKVRGYASTVEKGALGVATLSAAGKL